MIRFFKGLSPNALEIVPSTQRIIPYKSIEIEDSRESTRLSFSYTTRDWTVERLQPGNPIEVRDYHPLGSITDTNDNSIYDLEWAGVIVTVTLQAVSTDVFVQECECEGWQKWLNRRLVKKKYPKGNNSSIVFKDVVDRFTEYMVIRSEGSGLVLSEFNPANVDEDASKAFYLSDNSSDSYAVSGSQYKIQFPTWFSANWLSDGVNNMPELDYDWIPVCDVFSDIAEKTGYVWWVTPGRIIYYTRPEDSLNLSPLPDNLLAADADMTGFSISNYYDLVITETIGQIKNWIIGVGAKYPADYTIIREIGSAVGLTFPWGTEAFSRNNDTTLSDWFTFEVIDSTTKVVKRSITTIKKDKIDSVVGDGKGDNATIYADLDRMLARLPDNFGLASGESLRITLKPAVQHPDPLPWAISLSEMQRREGATSGKYEYRMSLEGIFTEDGKSATAAMGQVAERYGEPVITGNFKSRLRGWRAGQRFDLRSNRYRMSSARQQFDRDCFVTSVTKSILSPMNSSGDTIIESEIKFAVKPVAGVGYLG